MLTVKFTECVSPIGRYMETCDKNFTNQQSVQNNSAVFYQVTSHINISKSLKS